MTALVLFTLAAGPLDVEPENLKPGLVGEYRSIAEPKAVAHRLDAKPAFTLGRSSPHPRIPVGPFEVTWTGVLSIRDPGPIAFSAIVGGELVITVDGVTVLDGRGATETSRVAGKPLTRESGVYPLTIRFRSLADVPARLQLWWEGPSFAPEIIPAWRFGHLEKDLSPAAQQDLLAHRGRTLAGKFGCARCHDGAFPGVIDPPPGPSLADASKRLYRAWLLDWLADPAKLRADAHMPALFASDRAGFVERWLLAEHLGGEPKKPEPISGDHRAGRLAFRSLGCAACHLVPDVPPAEQAELNRTPFIGLGDLLSASDIATFLGNPHGRYPDGRMPRLPVTPDQARDIAAYLLLWSKPTERPAPEPPSAKELQDTIKRLGARDAKSAALALISSKGCATCHPGLGDTRPKDVPVRQFTGCLTGEAGPRFALDDEARKALTAYVRIAAYERYPSPFVARQEKLARAGCVQCHQRDTDRPPPIEQAGSKLGGGFLAELPFLRTPRMTNPHQKLTRIYLATTVREGNPGLRGPRFSYRMPAFGADADELLQAIAEADGELVTDADPPAKTVDAPTLGTLHGSRLAGFQGYACVSCHVWNGRHLASADPVATGPDLTRTIGRVRRDWFDRFVENPLRYYPATPMPGIFPHGQRATLTVLDGDPAKQKEALWAFLTLGKDAPSPKPPPPVPIDAPNVGEGPIVAQIPIRFADGQVVESLSLLSSQHDLLVYDLGAGKPHTLLVGGQILRNVQGRIRQFLAAGTPVELGGGLQLAINGKAETATERTLLGYDRLPDGARVRWKLRFPTATVEVDDVLHLPTAREFVRVIDAKGMPAGYTLRVDGLRPAALQPDRDGRATATITIALPPAKSPPTWDVAAAPIPDPVTGSLERPGYKAIPYPRPKTVSGEDRVMPAAVGVRPKDGQVFVASLKTGELFALRDPAGDGKNARFENYGHGLFQDALSMKAEDDGLYVLHRRNLTKITEHGYLPSRGPYSFDRVAALPHGIADTYDMAYGLARDAKGNWVFGYAPYSDQKMIGAGGAVRLSPGKPVEEIAFGMRNPLGWCAGPQGEIFFTDNQGDWVATNKLCHLEAGKFYGWPNRGQPQHHSKSMGKAAVWVPYGWAQSINGVAFDDTGGKFGPFAGQFFLAELMFGGAIIRADVEKVNGVYQGACFPFWGKGLLGPLCLAFDPRGKLYVGSITEPGWMAQPDRGALFRIDYTGRMPFEMRTIRARPNGFRIEFTAPVDPVTAGNAASYRLEHYRYEYTGAYGSPELDRTTVKLESVHVSRDGMSVELTTGPLVKDRVYLLTAGGVRSAKKEALVNSAGAYTLNEVPR
jgi:mono/diheme cytochrome c family protein